MSKIFFFTDPSSIQSSQTIDNAFGPLNDIGSLERYNLENKFSVVADAPAYSITKSMVLAMTDSTNNQLLNIAILPLNTFTCGFPIKMFIYRGIKKTSLIATNGKIQQSDSSWGANNILKVIQDLQTKINAASPPAVDATSDCLGLNFESLPDSTYIEQLFYDDTDDFHPIIVDGGCQIGKFIGGNNLAGIEVILDVIGYEPTVELLKTSSHVFEIQKLVLSNSLTEKEKLIQKFNNRFQKEKILSYLDITAFYGAAKNQGNKIENTNNDNTFLTNFNNKNKVYIDVRDNHGFSYNHFFKLKDELKLGFYSANSSIQDPVYTSKNYYTNWPILILSDEVFNNSKSYFYLTIPIIIGSPENLNFISSYVGKIATSKDSTPKKHLIIANSESDTQIELIDAEPIQLKNWKYSDNKLGANYFLLKKGVTGSTKEKQDYSSIWKSFFSLKMKNIFGFDQIIDGNFRVYTYCSINSPLIVESENGEIYYPTTGIAIDKNHVSFFSYKEEMVYKNYNHSPSRPIALIGKGKFNFSFNPADYNYPAAINPHIGFLHQIVNSSKIPNFELKKFSSPDPSNNANTFKYLNYIRTGDFDEHDDVFESFNSITLTHDEYNVLLAVQMATGGDFPDHPIYIDCLEHSFNEYDKFTTEDFTLTVGVATIVENDDPNLNYLDINDTTNNITYNNLPIILSSISA